jgi:isoleucyl-tRNA synthetase
MEDRYDRLLAIRSEVSKALELARNDKVVGHSLDARVLLSSADSGLHELLNSYRQHLAALFIVSQVELLDDLQGGLQCESLPGLGIRVEKALGDKCERCWNYSTTVGDSAEHPNLCQRCVEVLSRQ